MLIAVISFIASFVTFWNGPINYRDRLKQLNWPVTDVIEMNELDISIGELCTIINLRKNICDLNENLSSRYEKSYIIKKEGGMWMEDTRIVDLYWARSENAIVETSAKYGKYCYSIAYNILANREDADESVNDTYLDAWNTIPPHRPSCLSTFLGKITRRISIDKWRSRTAEKRGGGEIMLALDELSDCVPSNYKVEEEVEAAELAKMIDNFIMTMPPMDRRVFICRYWYLDSISVIAQQFNFSESKVKMILHRQRRKLLSHLERMVFL